MTLIIDLLSNFTLIAVAVSWFLAQTLKVIIYRREEGCWNLLHFLEAGGMPSAHSATVTALTLSIGLSIGFDTALFTTCFVFALIVMYDATGVRRAAGKQAELLNKIVDDIYSTGKVRIEKLKELLGHDPIEVFAGASLAVFITLIVFYVYFIR
ncbi:acid phosphatase [Candidatus Saganbacteria bacterium CG08_land_8_20_14_0_20_45_16]|uniref:Acid phosphatase n=1 Tax=Candidatus Saganbacteria bacterium CG08_land_8_20_14_0_20_45_16 TaxID=2014293 RepID=A0A2H0XVQ0_UNCSA|nr:MAG: acid phosphatase [Candidatus Saganbacteria bacterium CG08_land_8_20_14_0_20_45_16]